MSYYLIETIALVHTPHKIIINCIIVAVIYDVVLYVVLSKGKKMCIYFTLSCKNELWKIPQQWSLNGNLFATYNYNLKSDSPSNLVSRVLKY